MKFSRSFAMYSSLILVPANGVEYAVRRNLQEPQEQMPRILPNNPEKARIKANQEEKATDYVQRPVCTVETEPIKENPFTNPDITPKPPRTKPFCARFDKDNMEGFDKCPLYFDNILVSTSVANGGGPSGATDYYLRLQDKCFASLACGQGQYVGDWTDFVSPGCNELCFDVKAIANTGEITPKIVLQGGPASYYRAVFSASSTITDNNGPPAKQGWHTFCAPLAFLDSGGNMPSNADGAWTMGCNCDVLAGSPCASPCTPPAPSPAWNILLTNVRTINLVVDYTGSCSEIIGYDNICIKENDCDLECDPNPLCHWQFDWDCPRLKKMYMERLYELIKKLGIRTFGKKDCMCKILQQCCPDRCDMAKQEFLALLLNVAAGYLELECCVKDCPNDSKVTVKDVIRMVDSLLAKHPRTEYECSRAMALATGINENMTLCEEQGKYLLG